MDVCIADCSRLPDSVLQPYWDEGVGQLVLDRPAIEAMGMEVREYPLAVGERYIRHDPDALAEAIMEVFWETER